MSRFEAFFTSNPEKFNVLRPTVPETREPLYRNTCIPIVVLFKLSSREDICLEKYPFPKYIKTINTTSYHYKDKRYYRTCSGHDEYRIHSIYMKTLDIL